MKTCPAIAVAAALAALSPVAAFAGLSATATIASSPTNNGLYHYDLVLTNTGSTTVGSFWFAWIPGAGFMSSPPSNIQSPVNWTATTTNAGGSIQWVTNTRLQPSASLSGFSFDSPLTPAQMAGPSSQGPVVDTSFVYIGAPLGDPGEAIVPSAALAASPAVASILPGSRSVQAGGTATVFADMVNGSTSSLSGCQIGLPSSAPSGLVMSYQTTNPATNALTGTSDTPVAIAGSGSQTFLLSFTSSAAMSSPGLAPIFQCAGVQPVATILGVNTIDLLFSATPVPDVIALAATASGNGIVTVPLSTGGAGAFAVATANVGSAGTITVTADTAGATLPLGIAICQTNPATSACMTAPASAVTLTDNAGDTPTFSVFVTASAVISLDPANSRIFLRFEDSAGTSHGSTSVAVQTD